MSRVGRLDALGPPLCEPRGEVPSSREHSDFRHRAKINSDPTNKHVAPVDLSYASCHMNRQGRQEPPRPDRRAVHYPHEAPRLVLELDDHLGGEQLHVEDLEVRVGKQLAQLLERPGRVQLHREHLLW